MNPMMNPMMLNYTYGIPQVRPVNIPNQIPFPYAQMQPQLFYQMNQPQIQAPQNPTQTFINPQVVNQIQVQTQPQIEQTPKSQEKRNFFELVDLEKTAGFPSLFGRRHSQYMVVKENLSLIR